MPAYGANGVVGPMGGGLGATMGMQRFLISQGYQLHPDGVMGPRTQQALNDWHSGAKKRNPSAFNARFAPKAPSAPGGGGAHPPGAHPPAPTGPGRPAAPGSSIVGANFINPAGYVHAGVNAEYNPMINELIRQRTGYAGQEKGNIANIQSWYDNALDEAGNATKDDASGFADSLTSNERLAKSMQAALGGGDAASGVAQMSVAAQQQLNALKASARGFDLSRERNTAQAGAEASLGEHTRIAGLQKELGGQIADAYGAKGAAYKTGLADAEQLRMQQQVAKQNADYQAATQPLDIQAKTAAIKQAAAAAADEHAGNLQTISMNKIQIALGKKSLKNGTAVGEVPDFGKVTPDVRQKLRADLVQSAVNTKSNPMAAYNAWGNALRSYSPKWNPYNGKSVGAQQFRDNLVREYVQQWNAGHKGPNQFQWKFVQGKAPARLPVNPAAKK